MKALVTGASGFIGRHVVLELAARGIDVFALGRTCPRGLATENFTELADPGDASRVTAAIDTIRPDMILHLAGTRTAASGNILRTVNVRFAVHVLDAAKRLATPPRILLAGSAAEYGAVPEVHMPVQESWCCCPVTPYGKTKLAQTRAGLAAAVLGVPITIGRLFNVVGSAMPETLALGNFAAQIRAMGKGGGTLLTGDLDVVRDFVMADDVARVLVELALRPQAEGQVVNICSGIPTTLRELTGYLLRAATCPVVVQADPARAVDAAPRVFYGTPCRLNALGLGLAGPDPARLATMLMAPSC